MSCEHSHVFWNFWKHLDSFFNGCIGHVRVGHMSALEYERTVQEQVIFKLAGRFWLCNFSFLAPFFM